MPSRESETWMWAEAVELVERAERLHRQFFQRLTSAHGPAWAPPIDVLETGTHLLIVVALPGVAPDQVELSVDAGIVIVAGNRPLPAECRLATINRLEIPHGRFERRIELPVGLFELERREYVHGCLSLVLRKI